MRFVDYDFARLDLHDDADAALERRRGWLHAVRRGFHEGRHDDEWEKKWLEHALADDQDVRGAWLPAGVFGAGPVPVATIATFDKTLNAGHDLLPARLITDVATSPAHRRRGLLRRLMEDCLSDAAADGVPVVLLTASEATIYGRWGFGVATRHRVVEVDTRPGFALREFTDPGRVELVDPRESWETLREVFERFHRNQLGSVEWPSYYESMHTGSFDFEAGGEDKALLGAVHLDADEKVDGFVLYKPKEKDGRTTLRVTEMIALDGAAQLGLWSFLAGVDLSTKVRYALAHPNDPLPWALTDCNRARTTAVNEFLWLRVLDVRRTFEARPWTADGEVVIGVDDPQGHAAGTWEVVSRGGRATLTPSDREPEAVLDAETLGSLALGTVAVGVLASAGRISGDGEILARFAAMADLAVEPYNLTGF